MAIRWVFNVLHSCFDGNNHYLNFVGFILVFHSLFVNNRFICIFFNDWSLMQKHCFLFLDRNSVDYIYLKILWCSQTWIKHKAVTEKAAEHRHGCLLIKLGRVPGYCFYPRWDLLPVTQTKSGMLILQYRQLKNNKTFLSPVANLPQWDVWKLGCVWLTLVVAILNVSRSKIKHNSNDTKSVIQR